MKVLNVMYHIAPHSIIAFNLTSFYGEGKGFERKKLIDVISKKMITKALEPNVSGSVCCCLQYIAPMHECELLYKPLMLHTFKQFQTKMPFRFHTYAFIRIWNRVSDWLCRALCLRCIEPTLFKRLRNMSHLGKI